METTPNQKSFNVSMMEEFQHVITWTPQTWTNRVENRNYKCNFNVENWKQGEKIMALSAKKIQLWSNRITTGQSWNRNQFLDTKIISCNSK